jgi:hypothetical protein
MLQAWSLCSSQSGPGIRTLVGESVEQAAGPSPRMAITSVGTMTELD